MNATSHLVNIRIADDLFRRVERVREWLSRQVPGATRTDAVRMVIQKGLESLESDAVGMSPEDRDWMGSDISRLGEFEPYDFNGMELGRLGAPVRHLPNGAFVVKASR
ncbi:MAG: hypothetical protein AB1714_24310 [Acidobacteriota bacterium]